MSQSPERPLRLLGLAKRGGNLIAGAPLIFTALHRGKRPFLVVAAADASPPSRKKLCTQCEFYQIPLLLSPYTKEDLAHAVGKDAPIAAVAVLDSGLAGELQKSLGKDVPDTGGGEEK